MTVLIIIITVVSFIHRCMVVVVASPVWLSPYDSHSTQCARTTFAFSTDTQTNRMWLHWRLNWTMNERKWQQHWRRSAGEKKKAKTHVRIAASELPETTNKQFFVVVDVVAAAVIVTIFIGNKWRKSNLEYERNAHKVHGSIHAYQRRSLIKHTTFSEKKRRKKTSKSQQTHILGLQLLQQQSIMDGRNNENKKLQWRRCKERMTGREGARERGSEKKRER